MKQIELNIKQQTQTNAHNNKKLNKYGTKKGILINTPKTKIKQTQ